MSPKADRKKALPTVIGKAQKETISTAQVDTIEVFPRGVKTVGFSPRVGLPDGAGGVRGEITGWSASSRRRLREWLLTHESIDQCFSVTLTIPGSIVSKDDWKKALQRLSVLCARAKVGLVWRLEIQTRGQAHLHCISTFCNRPLADGCTEGTRCATARAELEDVRFWWLKTWSHVVDTCLPFCDGKIFNGMSYIECLSIPRSWLMGASKYMVEVSEDTGSAVWWRYLCDHTTKSKQAQICDWSGVRHWGKIYSKAFRVVTPEVWTVERVVFKKVYRWVKASTCRRVSDDRCVFGSRKVLSPRRSCAGSAVWFGVSPAVIEKLLKLASVETAGAGAALAPVKALKRLDHATTSNNALLNQRLRNAQTAAKSKPFNKYA